MKYRLDAPLDELLGMVRDSFTVAFEPMSVAGNTIEILQIQNMTEYLDKLVPTIQGNALEELPLWAKVWPASFMLGHFLRTLPAKGKSLLEVGAGCGVTGLIAAQYGFEHVVISDIEEEALLFAQINVLQNNMQDTVSVQRIDLTSARLDRRFDYIAGAEVLYLDALHRPLVKFLKHHLAKHPESEAILAKDYKRKAKKFFKLAERDFLMAERTVGTKASGSASDSAGTPDAERALFTIHRLKAK